MFKFAIPLLTTISIVQAQELPVVSYAAFPVVKFMDSLLAPNATAPESIANPIAGGPTLFAPAGIPARVHLGGYIFNIVGWNSFAPGTATVTPESQIPFEDKDVLLPATTQEQLMNNVKSCKGLSLNAVSYLLSTVDHTEAETMVLICGFSIVDLKNPSKNRNVWHLSANSATTQEPCWGQYAMEFLCTKSNTPRISIADIAKQQRLNTMQQSMGKK